MLVVITPCNWCRRLCDIITVALNSVLVSGVRLLVHVCVFCNGPLGHSCQLLYVCRGDLRITSHEFCVIVSTAPNLSISFGLSYTVKQPLYMICGYTIGPPKLSEKILKRFQCLVVLKTYFTNASQLSSWRETSIWRVCFHWRGGMCLGASHRDILGSVFFRCNKNSINPRLLSYLEL